jgi:hypothetical protein
MFGSRSARVTFFSSTPNHIVSCRRLEIDPEWCCDDPNESRHVSVQQATLQLSNERRVVFYWYLWNDFSRDPEKGVMTVRLHIPVTSTEEDARASGEDFIRTIFPQVILWRRF